MGDEQIFFHPLSLDACSGGRKKYDVGTPRVGDPHPGRGLASFALSEKGVRCE